MKNCFILFVFLIAFSFRLSAQVTSDYLVNIHDLSTNDINSLTSVEAGMLAFDTDKLALYVYDGSKWIACKSTKVDSIKYNQSTGNFNLYQSGASLTTKIDYKTPLSLSGTSLAWNYSLGYNAKVTLSANSSLSITNATAGSYGTIVVSQNGTGGYDLTLPANSKVMCNGTGVIDVADTANAISVLTFYYDGTTYYWTYALNFD